MFRDLGGDASGKESSANASSAVGEDAIVAQAPGDADAQSISPKSSSSSDSLTADVRTVYPTHDLHVTSTAPSAPCRPCKSILTAFGLELTIMHAFCLQLLLGRRSSLCLKGSAPSTSSRPGSPQRTHIPGGKQALAPQVAEVNLTFRIEGLLHEQQSLYLS